MTIRETALQAAREWIGTPYHHRARVKGAGCDCLMLIIDAYTAAGLIPGDYIAPEYPADIMFHSDDSGYLDGVMAICDEVETPMPGDIAMWKFGKTWSHGAIVSDWPCVIHAYGPYRAVVEMSVNEDRRLSSRPVRFFSPRGI